MKYKEYRQPTRCNNNGLLIIPVSSTCFGKLFCPKHVELTGIINKPLLLHLFGCLYYLYQWCTVKQISDNAIYLLIKYTKSVLWRVAKRLSYIEDARCLKVKSSVSLSIVLPECKCSSSMNASFVFKSSWQCDNSIRLMCNGIFITSLLIASDTCYLWEQKRPANYYQYFEAINFLLPQSKNHVINYSET